MTAEPAWGHSGVALLPPAPMPGYHLAHTTFCHRFLYSRANRRLFPLRVSQQPCACPSPGTASGVRQAVCRAEKKGFSLNLSLNPRGTRRSDSPGPQGQVPPASFPRLRVPPASFPLSPTSIIPSTPRAPRGNCSPGSLLPLPGQLSPGCRPTSWTWPKSQWVG